MRIKGKKQVNGSPVIVFDTEGATIADIVNSLTQAGWSFTHLVVQYMKKDGTNGRKAVQPAQAASIYAKHHFTKWAFSATSQTGASVVATLTGSKNILTISKSQAGGWKEFAAVQFPNAMMNQPVMQPQQQQIFAQQPMQEDRIFAQEQQAEQQMARASLYGTDAAEEAPIKPNYERLHDRDAARQKEQEELEAERKKKHIPMLIVLILLLFTFIPLPWAIGGLVSYGSYRKKLKGNEKKNISPSLTSARYQLKTARALMIGGLVFFAIEVILIVLMMTHVISFSVLPF